MPVQPPSSSDRVGLREIAHAAGVCLMTVSLSLRDSPKISPPTRERIQRLAREMGYRPDPELSRLMKHLRASRTVRGRTGIAIIDFYPSEDFAENIYNRHIREGIVRRASELGFGVTSIHGAEYHSNLRGILNVVRSRGLDGVVFLPSVVPVSLDPAAAWDDLSVVATSNSIQSPRFHYVVPNQFGNTMRLIDQVAHRGRKRICAIFDGLFDARTGHNFTAAFKWHGLGKRILTLPPDLSAAAQSVQTARWLAKQKPDAVFAQPETIFPTLQRLMGKRSQPKFELIGLGAQNCAGSAFVDERADLVGSAAVELLAGMMYYHETGVPGHPRTTLIDGELRFAERADGTAGIIR